ncbi:MAG: hypothetical protein A2583_10295 [Bdellovibrionales bacterium RIFOXYD1_FULL_53_11]|nr:MAG: hypothetical protein A2583_10295 [Bdellovibrionales bacterium RIFOXYD1_FULL_53_11]
MRHKRSIFLINRPFQFKFTFFVCSWLFVLSLIYPLIIYNLFDFFMHYLGANPANADNPGMNSLEGIRRDMIWLLAFLQAVFLIITALISFFLSHRIAGPLYKLNKFFKEGAGGKINEFIKFRKNDHFPELAEGYNAMMHTIKTTLDSQTASMDGATKHIQQAMQGVDQGTRERLEKALAALKGVR